MNKQDLWNRITSNGCREMTEKRFFQALDELAIPATERERIIVIEAMKFARRHPDNGITQFFKSESYRSIPPASTFEQELKRRWPVYPIPSESYIWLKEQLLKGDK
jgi:hypothetical protein